MRVRAIPTVGATSRRAVSRRRLAVAALFLTPALLLYVVFVLAPVAQAVVYSTFKWNGMGPMTDFVGADNYLRALGDPLFLSAVSHNFLIMVLSLAIQLPFALGLALVLDLRFPGRAAFRLLFFVPYVISDVATAVLWSMLLRPEGGLVNQVLEGIGLGEFARPWLAEPDLVLLVLFVVMTWKYFGFYMIIFLAGLQAIPDELTEAAAIDGATRWQATRYVVVPLLGPTIRVAAFLSMIGCLQLFDVIWVMTQGGPVHASDSIAVYLVNFGLRRFQLGYGSAVAVLLFLMSLLLVLLYQRWVLRRDLDGAITRAAG